MFIWTIDRAIMEAKRKKLGKSVSYPGSALILAVVLTSLLAIVGALFVLSTRVDRVATSAISDNRDLNLAVDTLVAKISEQLVLDVPAVAGPNEEYYDYPGVTDRWLASSEPYDDDSGPGYDYYWPQISDVTGYLARQQPMPWDTRTIRLFHPSPRSWFEPIIDDYKIIETLNGVLREQLADADGDGIADAKWILLEGITSSRGVPIYAAVRVIDNCAVLNVNTLYRSTGDEHERRGDMLTDIYIDGLKKLGGDDLDIFIHNRARNRDQSAAPVDRQVYYLEAARRIDNPDVNSHMYALYDISDELSLRNRFILYPEQTIPRLEADGCLSTTLRADTYMNAYIPYSQDAPAAAWDRWQRRFDPLEGDEVPVASGYDFRHLLTTYNMDRIITPLGAKMININQTEDPNYVTNLYNLIKVLLANDPQGQARALQMAANIKDHIDQDSAVTEYRGYFGFERPCVYISEVAHNKFLDLADPNRPTYSSYAVELHKPYAGDQRPIDGDWRLLIDDEIWPVLWSGTSNFHVMLWQDDRARLGYDFADANGFTPPDEANEVSPTTTLRWAAVAGAVSYDVYLGTSDSAVDDSATPVSTGLTAIEYNPGGLALMTTYYWRVDDFNGVATHAGKVLTFTTGGSAVPPPDAQTFGGWVPGTPVFAAASDIKLQRKVQVGGTDTFITVDSTLVPAWLVGNFTAASFQRDITGHKCVRRLWDDSASESASLTLGSRNTFTFADPNVGEITIQARPANKPLTNIGEIGMVLRRTSYDENKMTWNAISRTNTEADVRLNVADPCLQPIFNYLTVFDPSTDGVDNDGDLLGDLVEDVPDRSPEWKIPGRININTAPWYVIAQLPWMQYTAVGDDYFRARAIVNNRVANGPYRSTADVMRVPEMASLGSDGFDNLNYENLPGPDFSDDTASDDLEERDLIFARISNLVTVRSDVFTAYILVRIGVDGPQKRVIAVLDRSNVYPGPSGGAVGKVKIRALHPVPDPR